MLILVKYFLLCFLNLFYNFPFLTVKQYHNFDLSANVETPCTTHGVHVFQTAFKFMQLPCSIFLCLPLVYSIQKKTAKSSEGPSIKFSPTTFYLGFDFLCVLKCPTYPLYVMVVCVYFFSPFLRSMILGLV